ncbi:MAG TPA: hypothetical protein VLK83_09405 [Rhodanobacteraceae bacterium]|nr:hypothetical protein [Rhodanobacteraceae bacterium]
MSADGGTARALAPLLGVADETTGLLVLTDFPDCFSKLLGFTICFDAATGFFVAGAFTGAGFADAAFATGLTTLATGLFAALLGAFFAVTTARFAFATGLGGDLCALLATALLRTGAFVFLA